MKSSKKLIPLPDRFLQEIDRLNTKLQAAATDRERHDLCVQVYQDLTQHLADIPAKTLVADIVLSLEHEGGYYREAVDDQGRPKWQGWNDYAKWLLTTFRLGSSASQISRGRRVGDLARQIMAVGLPLPDRPEPLVHLLTLSDAQQLEKWRELCGEARQLPTRQQILDAVGKTTASTAAKPPPLDRKKLRPLLVSATDALRQNPPDIATALQQLEAAMAGLGPDSTKHDQDAPSPTNPPALSTTAPADPTPGRAAESPPAPQAQDAVKTAAPATDLVESFQAGHILVERVGLEVRMTVSGWSPPDFAAMVAYATRPEEKWKFSKTGRCQGAAKEGYRCRVAVDLAAAQKLYADTCDWARQHHQKREGHDHA